MTGRLRKLIHEFKVAHKEEWTLPETARGCCVDASNMFHEFLHVSGMKSEVWDIVLDEDHDRYICPEWYPDWTFEGHCVVFVEGLVVDWTARQYNSKAPYPLIFTPKHDGDRKTY